MSHLCPDCGTEIPASLLSCPGCHRLVHKDRLTHLARDAGAAEKRGDVREALRLWREAIELLPPDSRQYAALQEKCAALSKQAGEAAAGERKRGWKKAAAGLGAAGLAVWKFKAVAGFLLGKGKLLLAGLTKASTFFSMLLAFGVYWAAWGWMFALGVVLSIYVHEMGHVAALRRLGIKATAPMFIPGLGAVVRLKQYPSSAIEDARIGLAGPLWGLGATAAAYLIYLATGAPIFAAVARFSAWINLFNLIPVWQLDGSRGFRAMTKSHRWWAVAAIGAAWFWSGEGLLFLIGIVAVIRALGAGASETNNEAITKYALLILALTAFTLVEVPLAGDGRF
ncbi:MAG: site-2 protease family protein [bacterium]|nr:site-2 protease family protein [bacterium]